MKNCFMIAQASFKRSWMKTIRRPVVLTFSLLQPLLWMLFFGFLFQRYTLTEMPPEISYLDFLTPGVCCMTVLFGASQSGIELIRDMQSRFLGRMIATPANKFFLIGGKISADVSRLTLQACIVLLLAISIGAKVQFSAWPFIHMLLSLALFATAFSSLSCWIALKSRSQENMATFVHLVNMPMLFTSTALVPSRQMPDWLAGIADYNPLSLVVNSSRQALLFGELPPHETSLLPLTIMAAGLFIVTSTSLRFSRIN